MTSDPGTLSRLCERLRTFVELSECVRSSCASAAEEAEGDRRRRCREVAERAAELGRESGALLERLGRLEGASRLRVAAGLFLSRRRQRDVARLAREVAGGFEDVAADGAGPGEPGRGGDTWHG